MTTIRLAGQDDAPKLAALMIQMQRHYGAPHPTLAALEADLRALPNGVQILVADQFGEITGLAAFTNVYPGPGLSSGLFLKELYVADSARGAGIGEALMRALARLALERGLTRVDWVVGSDNDSAKKFYNRLGGQHLFERRFYRLNGDALVALAD